MSHNRDRLGSGSVTDHQRLEVQDGRMSSLRGCAEPLPARGRLVRREALFERLSAIRPGGVGLVCASAGSGKTVLLQSWAEDMREPVAWVTVDRGEGDPQRFWTIVADALAGAAGRTELADPVAPNPGFRGSAVVERLLSGLDSLEEPLELVIDDLHELTSAEALACLELLLVQRPGKLRTVLASREEAELSLHRLRLAGDLTEIRGEQLRFSPAETRQLMQASGIELSDAGLALMHERTEGWVAGLRLAALSLAGHPDPERFVAEFSGSERTVAGYLTAEVLERQPAEVRELLLRTSILDRVSGPLADFLTGSSGSERVLQGLEEVNAFVTSLDVARSWFRYHHLFADFLRLELRRTDPASVGRLHRKAAGWYEEHGYPVEAIRHAQAAEDWRYAARLLADSYVAVGLDGRLATVRGLLSAFPREAAAEDPELAVALAGAQMFDGDLDDTAAYIKFAERLAGEVADDRRWRFDLRMASTKLSLAGRGGDLDATVEAMSSLQEVLAAQPAKDMESAADHRATALMNLGIAELWALHLSDARAHLEEAIAVARRIERPYLEVGCLAPLGIAEVVAGKPVQGGIRLAEQAIEIAEANGWADDPIIVPALVIQAYELVWMGDFEAAERRLESADRAQPAEGEPVIELVARYSRGLLQFGRGRLEEAHEALSAAESVRQRLSKNILTVDPRVQLIEVQVRLGQTDAAAAALAELSPEERDRAEMRLAAAAVHLGEGDPEHALAVLRPAIERSAPTIHPRTASMDALLFAAAAHDALGDISAVEESLERALDIAEADGLILPFATAPVRPLLKRHPRHKTAHSTLLSEILDLIAGSGRPRGEPPPLQEELSEAELRVVRYLPSNLRAPEIAAELFVSPNTVRTHMRHIYSKLDAHSRKEAVDHARELGLISSGSRLR
jgi:LuxR family transcriptional regulator, maltose regulon positive regulatory protein